MRTDDTESPRHYLREWRERRGLTQQELADKIGTFKSVISRYETGVCGMSMRVQFQAHPGA